MQSIYYSFNGKHKRETYVVSCRTSTNYNIENYQRLDSVAYTNQAVEYNI